jgi:hypothetical protein
VMLCGFIITQFLRSDPKGLDKAVHSVSPNEITR